MAWYNPFSWGADASESNWQDRDYIQSTIRGAIAGAQNRPPPQADGVRIGNVQQGYAAQIATGPQDQMRQGQVDFLGRQQAIASGQQAGAGELATQRQVARSLAAQQAGARMARGPMAGAAHLGAARNMADIGQAGTGQAQQAAMGDQQNANAMIASVLGQARGQDQALAGQQAGFQQQMNMANLDARNRQIFEQAGLDQSTSLANLQARLQTMGLNDAQIATMLQQLGLMNASEAQGRTAAAQGQQQLLGGLLSAGGTLGAAALMSDERLKTDVSDAGSDVDDMLDRLFAKTYRYKDERHGKGPRAGIMAQDLQRSKAGSRLVVETPDGLGVDVNKAISAALASSARLNQRVRALEGARK